MLNRNAKTLKVYSARITTSKLLGVCASRRTSFSRMYKHLYFVKLARMGLLRISINEIYANPDHTHVLCSFHEIFFY